MKKMNHPAPRAQGAGYQTPLRMIYCCVFAAFFAASCATAANARILNLSGNDQPIEVAVDTVSFGGTKPKIKKITLHIKNNSNAAVTLVPEKCYFQDDNGFHTLKIPSVHITAQNNANIPIESLDYYRSESGAGGIAVGHIYVGLGSSAPSMRDLNVTYLEINLCYTADGRELNGIYKIDVEKTQ